MERAEIHDPPVPRHNPWTPGAGTRVEPGWRGQPAGRRSEFSAADVITVAETAELLRCSERHVYNLVSRDELPGARHLGRSIVVVRPVLVAWLLEGPD